MDKDIKEIEAENIEMDAANTSYKAGFGVSEWETFLNKLQIKRLVELADMGYGTWGQEPDTLARIKEIYNL